MGLILAPMEIKVNILFLRSYLEVVAERYKNVQEKVREYYDDDELDAEAWKESKNKMEICYLLIAEGMTFAQESIADDIATLLGCIGDEYLDEDELDAQIKKLQEKCQCYEEIIAAWQAISPDFPEAGFSAGGLVEHYRNMIENLKEQIAILEGKKDFLIEINDSTASLFVSAVDLLTAVQNAIKDSGVNINGGEFSDAPGWLTVLINGIEPAEEVEIIEEKGRVVDEIIPERVTANINGTIKVYSPRENWCVTGGKPGTGIKKDENGRYEVAVAPKILIPDYPDDGKLWDDDFADVSNRIDVVLENTGTGKEMTIECVVTDYKAHSYNKYPYEGEAGMGDVITFDIESGIMQTSIAYPNSVNAKKAPVATKHDDGSIIEFIGSAIDFPAKDYKLVKIIVIEE